MKTWYAFAGGDPTKGLTYVGTVSAETADEARALVQVEVSTAPAPKAGSDAG